MNLFALFAIACAPGVCIALYVYLKDKHEREPFGLLARAFFFGMLSTLLTLAISVPINWLIPIDENNLTSQAVHAFVIVALVEELSKFVFVRGVFYPNANFNEPFDGIVYSVMVSMGFATFENVLYVIDGGWEVALLRMFTAVPAHATFAILMGFYLGKAKFEHRKQYYALHALGIATVFHGAYDYFWFISYVPGIWLGAIASLVTGVVLSRRAIQIHQVASPFHPERQPITHRVTDFEKSDEN
jgi:RsiW-degrading membrane proteinase PrsW (M82 family)